MIIEFAKKHGISQYQIAKISGLQQSAFSVAGRRPLDRMRVQTIKALALSVGEKPSEVLDELMALEGNPIIDFITNHPNLKKEMVDELEDLILWIGLHGGRFNNISFNRYYEEPDTDKRAQIAMENTIVQLKEFKKKIKEDEKKRS